MFVACITQFIEGASKLSKKGNKDQNLWYNAADLKITIKCRRLVDV
jgi:hypothetical protein